MFRMQCGWTTSMATLRHAVVLARAHMPHAYLQCCFATAVQATIGVHQCVKRINPSLCLFIQETIHAGHTVRDTAASTLFNTSSHTLDPSTRKFQSVLEPALKQASVDGTLSQGAFFLMMLALTIPGGTQDLGCMLKVLKHLLRRDFHSASSLETTRTVIRTLLVLGRTASGTTTRRLANVRDAFAKLRSAALGSAVVHQRDAVIGKVERISLADPNPCAGQQLLTKQS